MNDKFDLKGYETSHATLRDVDIVDGIKQLNEQIKDDRLGELLAEWQDFMDDGDTPSASYTLWELIYDRLNDLAPIGYYWGAHEGDGSALGFWEIYHDEDEYDHDGH